VKTRKKDTRKKDLGFGIRLGRDEMERASYNSGIGPQAGKFRAHKRASGLTVKPSAKLWF
jgi:hypothetical protein